MNIIIRIRRLDKGEEVKNRKACVKCAAGCICPITNPDQSAVFRFPRGMLCKKKIRRGENMVSKSTAESVLGTAGRK